ASLMNDQPNTITSTAIETLVITIAAFSSADSLVPRISTQLSSAMMPSAGRLAMPCGTTWSPCFEGSNGEWHHAYGISGPMHCISLLRYYLQAMPTADAPTAQAAQRGQ